MAAPPNNSNAEKLVQNLWDSVVCGGGEGQGQKCSFAWANPYNLHLGANALVFMVVYKVSSKQHGQCLKDLYVRNQTILLDDLFV